MTQHDLGSDPTPYMPNQDLAFLLAVAFTLFNLLISGFFMASPV